MTAPAVYLASKSKRREDLLRQLGSPSGLHEQVAASAQAAHRDDLAVLLDDPEVTRIEVTAEAGTQSAQGGQQE